jgi:hypothetical protein
MGKESQFLDRLLHSIFDAPELLAAKKTSPPLLADVWLGHQDMQLMAARDKGGSVQGLYVACWASHNGQSHNHNDVGNFIIYANGRPFIIDVGRPEYTRQTFSSKRYEIWAMQSAYHNLPTINGVMQQAGRRYAAKDVEYESGEDFAQLKMDISSAYPDRAGINSWLRTVRLNRETNVQIVDSFELKAPTGNIVQSLITPCEIVGDEPGLLILRDTKEQLEIAVQYDSEKLGAEPEAIDIDDENISTVWDGRLYRIKLRSKTETAKDTWTLRFQIIPKNANIPQR